ncbi:MAG: hypothetical protein CVU39_00195 [Chloroflexi bacterium HGW-Chloroflexi-10]|nr:MAG: hypothetical protein CVU39_00195 [Chloroflexi bacterium HGW-Chloroflexi-10]
MQNFNSPIQAQGRMTYIEVPFDAAAVFGKPVGALLVEGTVEMLPYRKKLLSRGDGLFYLVLSREMVKQLELVPGQEVQVSMQLTEEIVDEAADGDERINQWYLDFCRRQANGEEPHLMETIFTRRSIRKFTGQIVSDEQIHLLIQAGVHAPSAHNMQPWEFVVVRDPVTLQAIPKFHPYTKMLPQAGCAIVVCGNKLIQAQTGFLVEDCSAAIQNILLAAHGIGLGAVWCGLYPITRLTKPLGKLLNLPAHIIPVGLVALGYADMELPLVYRGAQEKIHQEKW